MPLSDILFTILIGPLKALFEIIYTLVFELTSNYGISIIGLSLIMNLMLLPLYNRTDAIQLEAIETDKRLKPFVSHIKKTFKGNEQFMMLQTCYRQNHYKPTDAIKGISPLLLEIPFFMAAYNYLSNLEQLQGTSFGIISDLGAPDGMIVLHGFSINLLPILMTVINIVSSMIYTKDAPLKTKLQLYGMAALFLVLLYHSPAGLVFYWTLNNLFSLIKNIFIKLKNPKLAAAILSSATGVLGLLFVLLVHPMRSTAQQLFVIALMLGMQLPLLVILFLKKHPVKKSLEIGKKEKISFFLCCIFLTLLIGVLIPSAVIKSSPTEFVDIAGYNPVFYVLHSFLLLMGIFIVWCSVFYVLFGNVGKRMMHLAVWLLSGIAVVNYMTVGTGYGTLNTALIYAEAPAFIGRKRNLLLLAAVVLVLFFLYKKFPRAMGYVCATLVLAALPMSVMNVVSIQKGYTETMAIRETGESDIQFHIIPLSKNGKNVVVLMMDRAINSHIPYIFKEKPEVAKQFEGFTYYPNTISFGGFTNVGTPGLFGGYDYIPEEMNKRDQEKLADKHNEAMKVMPVLFDQNDFHVTVCDPSYAGYQWVPDLSVYDAYPDIKTYRTIGQYVDLPTEETTKENREKLNRSLFYYSLFRISPAFVQPYVYRNGSYNALPVTYSKEDLANANVPGTALFNSYIGDQKKEADNLRATGVCGTFYNSYTVLENLALLTRPEDSSENTFVMMSNETTHEPCLLQEPGYIPVPFVDNTEYEAAHGDRFEVDGHKMKMEREQQIMHYQINMAAMIQLGNWFDYLRENDLYDNTRIIIVSDHGNPLHQFDEMYWGDESHQDAMFFQALLMVKDFDSTEFKTDSAFMTNADVPALAADGLIENPVNPFTQNPLKCDDVKSQPQHILLSPWNVEENHGNTFQVTQWIEFQGNAKDGKCWKDIPPEAVG